MLWSVPIKKLLLGWLELSLPWEAPKHTLSNVSHTIKLSNFCDSLNHIIYASILRNTTLIIQALKCSDVTQALDFLTGAKSIQMMQR